MQSGKPVGVFRTHPWAPRVLIANALLVPAWATWDTFRDLEDRGLTMYGQMTAGSWIYIGTQGILQGTYETLAALARRHFGGTLAGRLVVTAGLGGMGGAQPLAVTMNGGVALVVEVDPRAHRAPAGDAVPRRARRDRSTTRSARVDAVPARAASARSIALEGNAADVLPELVAPRHHARRPHRSDLGARRAERLRPERPVARRSGSPCAQRDPDDVHRALSMAAMAAHVRAMLALQAARRGHVRLRQQHPRAGAARRASPTPSTFPGFVPEYIRPLFCEGKGPFRWAALSGDPADIAATDDARARDVRRRRSALPLDPPGARARRVPGTAGAHLLARLRRARAVRPGDQRPGAARRS